MSASGRYFPETPGSARTVSGGTVSGDDVTATTTTVSVTRTVQPLFIGGVAGRLVWSANVAADRDITGVRFGVVSGFERASVYRPGRPASAVCEVLASDAAAVLSIVVTCPVGAVLTVTDRWVQDLVSQPVLFFDPLFGDMSPNGALPPPASVGLPQRESESPARRSPQVRAAQREGSSRPDLMSRRNSLE